MTGVLIVTGGSRGIGAAVCELAARQGWDVAVNYRNDAEAAADVVARCEMAGRRAVAVQGDVAEETDVLRLFAETADTLGAPSGLINNAGIAAELARLDEYSAERIQRMMAVNVVGPFLCAREAVKVMSTRHGGSGGVIVNVGSAASYLGNPNEFIDYAASKGAIDTLTIGLSKEVATEVIRVNCVRPGLIDTEIHAAAGSPERIERLAPNVPMQRGGKVEEVAELVMWLASPAASYVTGSLVNVSGGR